MVVIGISHYQHHHQHFHHHHNNTHRHHNRHHWSCLKNYVLSWQLKSDLAATSASLERVAPSQLQYFIFYQTMPSGCFHKKTCCFRSKPRTNYGKSPSWYCDLHVLKENCLTLAPNSCLCLCAKHSEENTSFDHEIPHGYLASLHRSSPIWKMRPK